jgi:hypothetical protein
LNKNVQVEGGQRRPRLCRIGTTHTAAPNAGELAALSALRVVTAETAPSIDRSSAAAFAHPM